MTIEELKDKKRRLEEEIAEKVLAFEKETGLRISEIGFERILTDFNRTVDVEVNIELKL